MTITEGTKEIEAWEDEGGAATAPPGGSAISKSGAAAQVEWAERVIREVHTGRLAPLRAVRGWPVMNDRVRQK
jgi:hypothetical protein